MRLPPGVTRSLRQARTLHTTSYAAAVPTSLAKRGLDRAKVLLDEDGTVRRPLPPLSAGGSPIVADVRELKKASSKKRTTPAASSTKRSSKASSSKVKIEDAAGGVVGIEELGAGVELDGSEAKGDEDGDGGAVPTLLETSLRRDLARYPNALLLTQVGSFYESYFDQAPLVARELGIKLTSKIFGRGSSKIRHPFAGFPLSQLSKHVSALVSNGHRVVIVEEFKEPGYNAGSVGEISRRVTRIVTPGTGVDEGFIKRDEMNFVLAIGLKGVAGEIGLAYRDISTGASFTRISKLETLRDDLLLVDPKEIVVDEGMEERSELGRKVWELLKGEEEREAWMISTASPSPIPSTSAPPSPESTAEHVLLAYLASTLLSTPPPQTTPIRFDPTKMMQMDSTTLQSLEIRGSLRGGVKGSLLSTVRRTVTPGGSRLLAERLCSPSTELSEINSRLSLVATFHASGGTRPYLRLLLKTFEDTSRTLQRLFLRRGTAFDLLHLKRTILGAGDARRVIEDCLEESDESPQAALALLEQMEDHTALARAIEEAIDEEALVVRTQKAERRAGIVENLGVGAADKVAEEEANEASKTNGLWGKNEEWVVKAGFSPVLKELHEELEALRRKADQLEEKLRAKYEIKSLQLKVDRKLGPTLYIQGKSEPEKLAQDPSAVLVAKSGSSMTYVLTAWSQLSGKISGTMTKIREVESQTMQLLISRTLVNYPSLQKLSDAIDQLDVALGFAELARDMDLVRPIVNDGTSLTIVDGRHPTVEHSLKMQGRPFTSNSVHFSHPGAFIHCLTGPNMAGKSTFLRQTALIVILAQAGSFVPAESVTMGIVDRVFSRVGARDELDRDRSTFMVEMDEATSILNNATKRSLVLFDELGRGTSPLDGLAIAYAALEHLLNVNQSRTLFATHYHRLGELVGCDEGGERGTGPWEGIEFWCTDVLERKDSVEYLHTVRRGLNNDSAGIVVARLSGMPERAIRTAQELRARYEGRT